jgi:lysozyme family protein
VTDDLLVNDMFDREGRTYGDQHTNPPIDQPTAPGGIILATLSAYLKRPATLAELRALTVETATPIVRWKLASDTVVYHLDKIPFEPLRLQMLDFCYNSGPATAWKWLQSVLRVEPDGDPGPLTFAALAQYDLWLVNAALVGARQQHIDRWTDRDARRKVWEEGLENRGFLFSLLEIPQGY